MRITKFALRKRTGCVRAEHTYSGTSWQLWLADDRSWQIADRYATAS